MVRLSEHLPLIRIVSPIEAEVKEIDVILVRQLLVQVLAREKNLCIFIMNILGLQKIMTILPYN